MRTHMIHQYKKIKNSPMRSPSPDYACRNHSSKTAIPLQQSQILANTLMKNRPVEFPSLSIELMKRKKNSEAQNLNPLDTKGDDRKIPDSTTARRPGKQIVSPLPQISVFANEDSLVLHDFQNKEALAPQGRPINQSFANSPIKNKDHEEDSISIFQINQLVNENSRLKKELIELRSEIEEGLPNRKLPERKKQLRPSTGIAEESHEQDSSISNSTYQFFKDKISYLENELENQIVRYSHLEKEKSEEINLLKQKITQQALLLESQSESNPKLIHENGKNERVRQNSQDIKMQSEKQRDSLGKRRALSWDREQIVSLYDLEHFPEQSLYSQAEKVDIDQLFSIKKELSNKVEKLKEHYEEIIANNAMKYHENLESLQRQLMQLRRYLEEEEKKPDGDHLVCTDCKISKETVLAKDIQLFDLEREKNLLAQEIEGERKENARLKDLLTKKFNHEIESSKLERKPKGRGLQKISRRSGKSSGNDSREFTDEIFESQLSQNVRSGRTKLEISPQLDLQ